MTEDFQDGEYPWLNNLGIYQQTTSPHISCSAYYSNLYERSYRSKFSELQTVSRSNRDASEVMKLAVSNTPSYLNQATSTAERTQHLLGNRSSSSTYKEATQAETAMRPSLMLIRITKHVRSYFW
jgi:hypothetical protein